MRRLAGGRFVKTVKDLRKFKVPSDDAGTFDKIFQCFFPGEGRKHPVANFLM
jgi:hypothetical protein